MGSSIFVSVAAYRDPLLRFTVASARAQAADPGRVFFGVVEQEVQGQQLRLEDEWSRSHVRFTRVDALDSRGPCWARALAMALHEGEDWYLQVDSHTWFEPGWDERLVAWGERCVRDNPRAILSSYPNAFVWRDGHPVARPVTQRVLALVAKSPAEFAADHPVLMFEGVAVERDEPVAGFHIAGGCLFAPGRIVQELPYDPFLYFHGEEQSVALRAWTRGWDIFHVPGLPLYHLYTEAGAPTRPMHWSPEQDQQRARRSADLERAARARLARILWGSEDFGAYGLGSVRSLAEYAAFSGIDYAERRIEPRATKARFGY
jgi:hypothetical protein